MIRLGRVQNGLVGAGLPQRGPAGAPALDTRKGCPYLFPGK